MTVRNRVGLGSCKRCRVWYLSMPDNLKNFELNFNLYQKLHQSFKNFTGVYIGGISQSGNTGQEGSQKIHKICERH